MRAEGENKSYSEKIFLSSHERANRIGQSLPTEKIIIAYIYIQSIRMENDQSNYYEFV